MHFPDAAIRLIALHGQEFLELVRDLIDYGYRTGPLGVDGPRNEGGQMGALDAVLALTYSICLLEKSSAPRGLWSSVQRKPISSFLTWDVRQLKSSATTWRSNR